jgi:ABC-type transporter Mla MlaB component
MSWAVPEALYAASWPDLKRAGVDALEGGAREIDLQAWSDASSAHLAVLLVWWSHAQSLGMDVSFHGLNQQFQTLAKLGGVSFIAKESH